MTLHVLSMHWNPRHSEPPTTLRGHRASWSPRRRLAELLVDDVPLHGTWSTLKDDLLDGPKVLFAAWRSFQSKGLQALKVY